MRHAMTAVMMTLVVGLASACSDWLGNDEITPTGAVVERTVEVESFDAVEVAGPFDVRLAAGAPGRVDLSVDEALIDRVEVRVAGGILEIGFDGNVTIDGPAELRVDVPVADLRGIAGSGAATVEASGPWRDSVLVDLEGASSAVISDLGVVDATLRLRGASELTVAATVADLDVDLRGASTVTMDGTADIVRLRVTGASRVRADDLQAGEVTVDLEGASSGALEGLAASDATLRLRGDSELTVAATVADLDVDLRGASTVTMDGTADIVRLRVTGASRVRADDLQAGEVTVDLSGASHVEITADGTVTGSASGASRLRVDGGAVLEVETSGASTVETG